MEEETESLHKNKPWDLVEPPKVMTAKEYKWVKKGTISEKEGERL